MNDIELNVEAIEDAIENALRETRSYEEEDYIGNRPAFLLCVNLRGLSYPIGTSFDDLDPYFRDWYERGGGLFYDDVSFDEVRAQIIEAWDNVTHPKGDYLKRAIKKANKYSEPLPEFARYEDKKIQFLGRVIYEIKELRGDGRAFISGYKAGEILGKTQRAGRNALIMFVNDGILKVFKQGNRFLATTYDYLGNTGTATKKILLSGECVQSA